MTADTGTAVAHYDRLLAEHYTWMLGGDVHEVSDRQAALLAELGLAGSEDGGTAIDLGCGSGAQTLALVRLGFSPVIAVDTSHAAARRARLVCRGDETVRPVHGDIRTALPETAEPGTVAVVVCMGDTLPHLPSKAELPVLLGHISRALVSGGHLVVTYRDLTAELRGTDRFIPVRSSDDRLLTCFLEYRDEDTVIVHDLLHTRTNGSWQQRASSYPTLRIASSWLVEQCRAAGLHVRRDIVRRRPPWPGQRTVLAARAAGAGAWDGAVPRTPAPVPAPLPGCPQTRLPSHLWTASAVVRACSSSMVKWSPGTVTSVCGRLQSGAGSAPGSRSRARTYRVGQASGAGFQSLKSSKYPAMAVSRSGSAEANSAARRSMSDVIAESA